MEITTTGTTTTTKTTRVYFSGEMRPPCCNNEGGSGRRARRILQDTGRPYGGTKQPRERVRHARLASSTSNGWIIVAEDSAGAVHGGLVSQNFAQYWGRVEKQVMECGIACFKYWFHWYCQHWICIVYFWTFFILLSSAERTTSRKSKAQKEIANFALMSQHIP